MALPSFFIIGAAKAGTTSLYALLERHPDIFMPEIKEPEFFARHDLYTAQGGFEAYEASYDAALPSQIIGEASTLYSLSPLFADTAARIHAHVPQAKLIYVLRQPVDRAYSFYLQLIKNYQNSTRDYAVHRSFEDFVLPERHAQAAPSEKVLSRYNAHLPDVPELCLAGSDYVTQIEAYLAYFAREQMLFVKFEDFVADRISTVQLITDFLGVPPLACEVFEEDNVTRNISKQHFDKKGKTAKITALKKDLGPFWKAKSLVPTGLRTALREKVAARAGPAQDHQPPPLEPQTRALLQTRFEAQFDRLSDLTGLDLSDWRD